MCMKKLFDEIPVIESERLVLKRLADKDIPALLRLTGNERVYRYLPTFLYEKQYGDMRDMIRGLYGECFACKDSLILGIYLKDEGELCGLGEYYGFRDSLHKTCLGYRLREEYWGRGIATEAVGAMTGYAFSQTDTEIITASTMIENTASARVLEKNGFIRTARAVPEDWGFDEPVAADKWFR